MDQKSRLKGLYTKYNLTKEDVFKSPQGWVIITRSGIDNIQSQAKIAISYEPINMDKDFVVIKATGKMGDEVIETFGEASSTNTKNKYPIAMAEKRAMSRVVLKLSGFYAAGVFGEDEADDFKVKKTDRQPIGDLIQETLS